MEDRLEGWEVGEVVGTGGNNGGGRTPYSAVPHVPLDQHPRLVNNPRLETEPRKLHQSFNSVSKSDYGVLSQTYMSEQVKTGEDSALGDPRRHSCKQPRILVSPS